MNVLITGAAGGLGRAFAISCAQKGYSLFLTDVNKSGLMAIKKGLQNQYDISIITKECNLTNENDFRKLVEYIDNENVTFDMLLNVAGIDFEGGFLSIDSHRVSDIIRLNIEATLRITHEILQRRIHGNQFYIVFVSSLASVCPMPLKATYAASKRFLLDFSLALATEMRSQNVKILALCPGGLATTKEAMQGIEAQGFFGAVTTNRLEEITDKTILKVQAGRKIYIPGLVNRAFSFLAGFIPKRIIIKLLFSRWEKAQKEWFSAN